ncbi:MAG: IclR family transcriptional regulator [Burkholderiaceae bacterium]|nr:IclR family transcriptional regulator [Burkholderiaceae bacterium]
MAQPTIRPVPAVKRSIGILDHLARASEPQSLSQVARAVGIIPSSCLHILRELANGRLVRVDEERKVYSLGWHILELARSLEERDGFAAVAQPYLGRIAGAHNAVASASVFDGKSRIVVIASCGVTDRAPIHVPVGLRVPFLSSATGRVLAAFNPYPDATLRAAFDELNWQRPITFRQWKRELAEVRANGYAIDEGHYRRGITVVAAPVPQGERVDKFVGASMLSEQVSGKPLRELAEEMRLAGQAIAAEMQGIAFDQASAATRATGH